MQMPGWPLFAFSTASMQRNRMVSIAFCCSSGVIPLSWWEVPEVGREGIAGRQRGGAEQTGSVVQDHMDRHLLEERPHAPLGAERLPTAAGGEGVEDLRGNAAGDEHAAGGQRLQGEVAGLGAIELAEEIQSGAAE